MSDNKKKQVEALAKDIYSMLRSDAMSRAMASMMYGEGYRKASEVAEEIFEEIDKQIAFFRMYMFLNNGVKAIVNTLDEIKKKYTEGEKHDD